MPRVLQRFGCREKAIRSVEMDMVRKSLRNRISTISSGVSGALRVTRNPTTRSAIISIFFTSMARV